MSESVLSWLLFSTRYTLLPARSAHHSASGLAINICDVLVEEGGPRVEAKRIRWGPPSSMPAAEPNIRSERAAACSFGESLCTDPPNDPPALQPRGCPVHIRTPNRTPETNTNSVRNDSSTVS